MKIKKIDSISEKLAVYGEHIFNCSLPVGVSSSGKISWMSKFISRMSDGVVERLTKSPHQQYSIVKTKEVRFIIKPLKEYDNSVVFLLIL